MIVTVVRQYSWTPTEIGRLYLDDEDYLGLEFWYNDVIKINSEMKKK
jgi:hypothetical protein